MKKLNEIIFCLLAVLIFVNNAYAIDYTYTELLPLGWTGAWVNAINNSGVVAGYGNDATGNQKGFVYDNGTYTEILPSGWTIALITGINDNGVAVGYGKDATGTYNGFVYNNGTYELVPSGWRESRLADINDFGDIIGSGYPPNSQKVGFLYSEGAITQLSRSYADSPSDINNNGDIIGTGGLHAQAFLYRNGSYTDLMPPGWTSSYGKAINDNGDIVGWGTDGLGEYKGFLYSDGSYTELMPPGWSITWGVDGINNSQTVVGWGQDSVGNYKGFVYDDGFYNELLPLGWISATAKDVNSSGVIIGSGHYGSGGRSFIATPVVPEPISSILFITGGATLFVRRYLKRRKT